MQRTITILLILVGVMNLYPVIGVLSADVLANLYGVTILDNDLLIMMRHRAILLGILGIFIVISAFRPNMQAAAIIAGLTSMILFIGLVLVTGDYGESIKKVMLADVVGTLLLLIVIFLRWLGAKASKQE
jgi:hypothetical protein